MSGPDGKGEAVPDLVEWVLSACRTTATVDSLWLVLGGYVLSPEFAAGHPGVGPRDVLVGVVCHQPPTAQMLSVTEVGPRGRPDQVIRVVMQHCPAPSDMPWFVAE